MSAINGIFNKNGQIISEELIKRVNDSLSHRGPDGSSIWCEKSIALGHQMLHTTPESLHEKLPLEEDGLVITADARLDNRKELSHELVLQDEVEISDSYFILKAYQKWGDKCPEELLGDFAFIIWDKDKDQLFGARDHMGVKPFYYYINDDLFCFASEIRAILKHPVIPVKLDQTRVAHFLTYLFKDRRITFYEDILRLPAAHKIIVTSDDSKLERYWKLDHHKRIILDSDEEYADEFLEIFHETVRSRLRSAFPVGSMLSGGLDSSSIVCTAREILMDDGKNPLNTFSLIFKKTAQCDESPYINHVLAKGHLSPHMINTDDYSPVMDLNMVLWDMNAPNFAYNFYFNYLLYESTHNSEVRVLLDGLGGDITVSYGTGLLEDLLKKNQWKEFYREVKGISERYDSPFYKTLGYQLLINLKSLISDKFGFKKDNYHRSSLLRKEFLKKVELEKQREDYLKNHIELDNKSLEGHYNSLNSAMIQYILEEADRLISHFNLEPRYPFFDVRLVEFCLAIPTSQKHSYGWDRAVMRRAMSGILPPEIQWRRNKMYGVNSAVKNFLKQDNEFIESVIQQGKIDEYVDVSSLRKSYDKLQNKNDFTSLWDVWIATSLGLWLDLYW